MPLWSSAILFLIVVIVIIKLISFTRSKGKNAWVIVSIVICAIAIFVAFGYIILTFILIGNTSDQPSDELKETSDATIETSIGTLETSSTTAQIQAPMPADYDFPADQVPDLHPDILGIRNTRYEKKPTFDTQNEITKYVLYNLLNNQYEFEFYINKDLATDEGTGFCILNDACETAMSYYLFSAYNTINMFVEDCEYYDKVYAKITLVYKMPDYDLEAKAKALEFVKKNPIPDGGFKDFESEKLYAKRIHDFICKKVTYSSIGYDPESMLGLEKYEACQEAYNVLDESQTCAVCAGYARSFALIAQYSGINCAWVYGNETETTSHAWNIIYPCDDSEPVLIDVTWDDTQSDDIQGNK